MFRFTIRDVLWLKRDRPLAILPEMMLDELASYQDYRYDKSKKVARKKG